MRSALRPKGYVRTNFPPGLSRCSLLSINASLPLLSVHQSAGDGWAGSHADASSSGSRSADWLACAALEAMVTDDSRWFPWRFGSRIHYRQGPLPVPLSSPGICHTRCQCWCAHAHGNVRTGVSAGVCMSLICDTSAGALRTGSRECGAPACCWCMGLAWAPSSSSRSWSVWQMSTRSGRSTSWARASPGRPSRP